MNVVQVADMQTSKTQFALLLQTDCIDADTKMYIIQTYPKELVDQEQLDKYFTQHPAQQKVYADFLQMCALEYTYIEKKFDFKLFPAPKCVPTFGVAEQALAEQKARREIEIIYESDNIVQFSFPALVQHLLQQSSVKDHESYFLQTMYAHPQLNCAYYKFSEEFYKAHYDKYLKLLQQEHLIAEKQSAERDAILLANACDVSSLDLATKQAAEDLSCYRRFLQGGVASDMHLHCITDRNVGDTLDKMKLQHLSLLYLHYCAINDIKTSKFDSKLLQETKTALLQESALYAEASHFQILQREELRFSVLVKSSSNFKLNVNVYLLDAKVTALADVDLKDIVLTAPEYHFELQNAKSVYIHSFYILPDFQTDFVVYLSIYQQEQSFLYKFPNAMFTRIVSPDLRNQDLMFSHELVSGRSQVECCVSESIFNEFRALPYAPLAAPNFETQHTFEVHVQQTFFQAMQISYLLPQFDLFDTINPEDLLVHQNTIIFDVFLLSKSQQQQLLDLEQFPCTLIVTSGEKTATFASRGLHLEFTLPKYAKSLELSAKFVFAGKERSVSKAYHIQHTSCLRLLRQYNRFLLRNLIDEQVDGMEVQYSGYSGRGHVSRAAAGDAEFSGNFRAMQAYISGLLCEKSVPEDPLLAEYGKEQDFYLYENAVKAVNRCSDFSKDYFAYRDGKLEPVQVFQRIGGFRLFYDHSYDVEPCVLRQFEFDFHSSHDYVIASYIPRNCCLSERVSIPFHSKDTYVVYQLLAKPHFGIACEVPGLQMVEKSEPLCDDGVRDCMYGLYGSTGCGRACSSAGENGAIYRRSVRNYFTRSGSPVQHVVTLKSDGQIRCVEK